MDGIARASADERRRVFEAASQKLRVAPAIVEKDFWVCFALDCLFHKSEFAKAVVFKGGTSLSKGYGLIRRFSEDIDLILDWRELGYGIYEPWEDRSNSKQEKFKAESMQRLSFFLDSRFVPTMRRLLSEALEVPASIRCGAEEGVVLFDYPRSYMADGLLDTIKFEIGPLAAWSPSEEITIKPLLVWVMPGDKGSAMKTLVRMVRPERTFWEKVTILHQEANRPETKQMPRRYSRHYYDVYQLGHSPVLDRALEDLSLLESVVAFKEKFYRTPWAKLLEAKPGSIRLVPPEFRLVELQKDYSSMRTMFYGDYPITSQMLV